MISNLLKTLSAAATAVVIGAAANAATLTTPDILFIESAGFRGDGTSSDIVNGDLGMIAPGKIAGIAGRIKNQTDSFTFETSVRFSVSFVDLADLLGIDIDPSKGFDPTFVASDSPVSASFSLIGPDMRSAVFTSPIAPDFTMFGNVAPGKYTLLIDGTIENGSSTYDIAISAVPLPAAGVVLLGGLGLMGALKRRKAIAA